MYKIVKNFLCAFKSLGFTSELHDHVSSFQTVKLFPSSILLCKYA